MAVKKASILLLKEASDVVELVTTIVLTGRDSRPPFDALYRSPEAPLESSLRLS